MFRNGLQKSNSCRVLVFDENNHLRDEETFSSEISYETCDISIRYEQTIQDLTNRVDELQHTNQNLKKSNQQLTVQVCNLEEQISDLIRAKIDIECQTNDLKYFYKNKLEEKDCEIDQLNCKLDKLIETAKLKEEMEKFKGNYPSNAKEIIETSCEEFRSFCSELEMTIRATKMAEDKLKEDLNEMSKQIQQEFTKNSELFLLYRVAQERIDKLEDNVEELKSEIDVVTTGVVERGNDIDDLRQILDCLDIDESMNFEEIKSIMNENVDNCYEYESADEAVDCQSNIEDLSSLESSYGKNDFGSKRNFNKKSITSTALKRSIVRPRIKRNVKSLIQKAPSFLDEIKNEHPEYLDSLPGWNIEMIDACENENNNNDNNNNNGLTINNNCLFPSSYNYNDDRSSKSGLTTEYESDDCGASSVTNCLSETNSVSSDLDEGLSPRKMDRIYRQALNIEIKDSQRGPVMYLIELLARGVTEKTLTFAYLYWVYVLRVPVRLFLTIVGAFSISRRNRRK